MPVPLSAEEEILASEVCGCFWWGADGQAALGEHTVVNVIAFAHRMDPVLELLDGAVTGLDQEFDAAAEARSEVQRVIGGIAGP